MPEALKALEWGVSAAKSEQAAAAASAKRVVTVRVTVASDPGGNTPARGPGKLGDRSPFKKAAPATTLTTKSANARPKSAGDNRSPCTAYSIIHLVWHPQDSQTIICHSPSAVLSNAGLQ